jgi:hypothetical protein
VDEGSRQIIVRRPVELAEASSVINLLWEAFRSLGAPTSLRTDGATFFASARFGDLMHSCGISHAIDAGAAARKGLAERWVKT